MKIFKKIAAVSLVLMFVCFIAGVACNGFDELRQLNRDGKLIDGVAIGDTVNYSNEFVSDEIENLDLVLNAGNMKVNYYDGSTIKVECRSVGEDTKIVQEGDTIHVENSTVIHLGLSNTKINVYIPTGKQFNNVKIDVNAGQMDIDEILAKDIDAVINAGDLNLNRVVALQSKFSVNAGDVDIEYLDSMNTTVSVDLGDFEAKACGHEHDYTVSANHDLGDIEFGSYDSEDVSGEYNNGTGSRIMKIDVSVGDAKIELGDD